MKTNPLNPDAPSGDDIRYAMYGPPTSFMANLYPRWPMPEWLSEGIKNGDVSKETINKFYKVNREFEMRKAANGVPLKRINRFLELPEDWGVYGVYEKMMIEHMKQQ